MIGEQIGSYKIVRWIGQGGMGAVYEAMQNKIQRRAAIKILRSDLSQDPRIANRFLNEARAVNIIHHPGVVNIYEHGRLESGDAYIIMEYLDGESLGSRLRRHRQLGSEALRIGRQIASALSVAHEKQIVHRDLKPDNIMLVPDGDTIGGERVKIFDFGIAKVAAEHNDPGANALNTQIGTVMGTPSYMAPEQCHGTGVTDRADVYALGVILYQMISGRLPFPGSSPGEIMAKQIMSPLPPLSRVAKDVDPGVAELVQRMLAKDPERRPSMRQVALDLEQLQAAPTSPAAGLWRRWQRPRLLAAATAGLLVSLAGAALLLWQLRAPGRPQPPAPTPAVLAAPAPVVPAPASAAGEPAALPAVPPGSAPAAAAPSPAGKIPRRSTPLRATPHPLPAPLQVQPPRAAPVVKPQPPPNRTNPDEIEYFK